MTDAPGQPDTRADVRLVPMTREPRDALHAALPAYDQRGHYAPLVTWALGASVAAWDAAPANPADSVSGVLEWFDTPELRDQPYYVMAENVLKALGYIAPRANPEAT